MRMANIFLLTASIIGCAIYPSSAQIFSAEKKATNFVAHDAAVTIITMTDQDGSVHSFSDYSSKATTPEVAAAPAAVCEGLWNGATNSIRFRVISQTQIDTFSITFTNLGGCSQVTVKTSPVFISGNTFTVNYNIPTISSGSLTGTFSSDGNSVSGNYTYRNFNCGTATAMGAWSGTPMQTCTVGVDERASREMPEAFALYSNYPNPFNPSTTIEYDLPQLSNVELKVYDMLGNEVQTLVSGERPAGKYRVQFSSAGLPSGLYFYRLRAGERVEVKKMVVVR